jgi:predicted transposase YbfD/YdcC
LKRSYKRRHWDLCTNVTDPRDRRGRRWPLRALVGAAFAGMLTAARSLRAVEDLTELMAGMGQRGFGFRRRVPDSTLEPVIRQLEPEQLRERLRAQVHSLQRSKALQERSLPLGLVAVDGKCLWSGTEPVHPACQRLQETGRPATYLLRTLRASLISSPTKVCLDQAEIPAATNERGAFDAFWKALVTAYGRTDLFEAVSLDAGFACKKLCTDIDADGYGYIVGLKDNQPELIREAQAHFEARLAPLGGAAGEPPEAETGWERYQGRRIKRQLWRTKELAGWHGWDHLRQVWLIRQLTEHADGWVKAEYRLFVTNLVWGRLTGSEILTVVRAHWEIENCLNWTTDVQWGEDQRAWCYQGNALLVLGLLRLMAFNVLQVLFKRHLKAKRYRELRWEQRFVRVKLSLLLPVASATVS